jgi:hypothetical protein
MTPSDPHKKLRDAQDPSHTLDRCHFRVDWQTLRRLPLSGAVVFNFKAVFTLVSEFRDEPYIPSLLPKVVREGKMSLMEYKNTWHTEHVVIPAIAAFEKEQIARFNCEGLGAAYAGGVAFLPWVAGEEASTARILNALTRRRLFRRTYMAAYGGLDFLRCC